MSTSASWNFREGDEIAPGLTAMRLLGGGSSYEAYLAFDDLRYSPVVVKIVRPDQVDDPHTLRGLEREVDTLGAVNHPAIVRGFHAVLDGPRPLVVLENLDGPRLSTLDPPARRAAAAAAAAAGDRALLGRALPAVGSDLVHLDIKPSNIIMGAPARLIDLSIARDCRGGRSAARPDRHRRLHGARAVRPDRLDFGPPGTAADMWGVGATLFHAAAGYRPFDRGTDDEAAAAELRWPQLAMPPYELPALGAVGGRQGDPRLPAPSTRPTPDARRAGRARRCR